VISVSHLTRRFGSFAALDDISFEVGKGEVVGFLGPNGAGKTTTMRILTGFLPATSGAVAVAGFDVLRQSLEARRRIGYLPESVPLYRELRVEEMLAFQARLHALERGEARRRIPAVLERVGLLDRSRDLVGTLSRGMRQRVGLALALLPEPEVLILDEPTSGLDPLQRLEVRAILRELAQKHTVLLSSHILPEIEAVCPRVIIVHKGRIAADGTPTQLVQQLSGGAFVRLEALVGADVEAAKRMLGSIEGVRAVRDLGRRGVHHEFELEAAVDVREDVGAIAKLKGWALRELSYRVPSLEQIFARIALGEEPQAARSEPVAQPPASAVSPMPSVVPPASNALPVSQPAATRQIYSLNPFDRGASRDLSAPVNVEAPAKVDAPQRPDA
jgi:ABC-2 type transport system ATP-binding protein